MRVQGDGEVWGGVWLLVDSAPALSYAVHKQTLINRRRSASLRCFFFPSVSHLWGITLSSAPPKETHARRSRGREQRGIRRSVKIFFFSFSKGSTLGCN